MSFWITVSLFILLITLLLALALFRKRDDDFRSGAELDLEVYRDQLKTVDTDLERNVINKQEAARLRTEISRRILDADKALKSAKDARSSPMSATIAAVIGIAVIIGGSVLVYNEIGAPGYPDVPLKSRLTNAAEARENRPSQSQIEAQIPENDQIVSPKNLALVQQLRDVVAKRPTDAVGHGFLARNEASIGEYKRAYQAQIKMIEIKQGDASADDFAMLGELMITAAGGYVSPQAETVLERAISMDKTNGSALYYMGLMFAQTGRTDITFNVWRDLLEKSAPSDPWVSPIRAQIMDAASIAGVNYTLPELAQTPALAGPTAADVNAAGEMSAEDRQEFINSMVTRLSERLASEGGSAKEWGQLIGALGIQGNTERAKAIYTESQSVFAQDQGALDALKQIAQRAGVAD